MQIRRIFPVLALLFAAPAAAAQNAAAPGLIKNASASVAELGKKMIDLANAIPADKFDWRPAEGVRSFNEVFLHVAADNYWFGVHFGVPAPASTGVAAPYATAQAYEQRKLGREAVLTELKNSFEYFEKVVREMPESKLAQKLPQFGPEATLQGMLVSALTHAHEHLGQSIAYARMNGVVPPWSR